MLKFHLIFRMENARTNLRRIANNKISYGQLIKTTIIREMDELIKYQGNMSEGRKRTRTHQKMRNGSKSVESTIP